MGLLLNVDYSHFLARARGREVLRLAGVKEVGEEEAIEGYYVHYRRPIFGGRASSEVWKRFLLDYIRTPYYEKIASLCRLNHRASREAAVRLIRAFARYLETLESRKWAWWGRGRQVAWVESLRQLRRSFGNPAEVEELYRVFKKLGEVLGRGRSGDPAALALSVAADPARVKLAQILAKSLEVATSLGWAAQEGGAASGKFGEFEVTYGSIERLRHAAVSTRLLFTGAPLLFLQRLAAAGLLIRRALAAGDRGIYLLVDKSGSMYGAVGGMQKIVLATAYALAVLKRRRDVVLRFFDVEIHEETTDLESLVDILTRVVAGGGTDITKAVLAAVEDAERRKRRYVLQVVTDGEDDRFDPTAVREARRVFKDVVFILVGGGRLEGVKTRVLKREEAY